MPSSGNKAGLSMRVIFLTDNNAMEGLTGEWGLSAYIEFEGKRILLDAGETGLFLENAEKLGVFPGTVDFAVLSHAHHDHANGFVPFFERFPGIPLYLQKCCGPCCGKTGPAGFQYIGIREDLFAEYGDRLIRVDGDKEIAKGVWIISHKKPGREAIGRREQMVVKMGNTVAPDDFSHEQSLVFETEQGLCIFNSCSHAGASEIIGEVCDTFPGRKVCAYVGGFHLYQKTPEEVAQFAQRLEAGGVEKIITGHCTGDAAFAILKDRLGEHITQFRAGLEMDI